MLVTLDVSKLSGWLNANAPCRNTQRHVEGDTGGWEAQGRVGAVWRCTQRARRNRMDARHGTREWVRTKNIVFMSVTLDVSRLSGWLNADAPCRVTRRHVESETDNGEVRGRVGAG